jgi:SOS response regulatory protein OraA/RecX
LLENDSDDENLLKSYEKISKGIVPKNRNEQQKIAAKLMQRWFDYSDIKKLLF